jgi:N6-adenosine-specific RNA methylase IME4
MDGIHAPPYARGKKKGIQGSDGGEGGVSEHPIKVHGRLQEAAHIAGYSFKRAWDELKWLLQEDRWQQLGFTDGGAFAESIYGLFSEFKGTIDQRKEVANALSGIASQRAIAKVLGVGKDTVSRDLGRGANAPQDTQEPRELAPIQDLSGANAPAFARDVDPYALAKKQEKQEKRREERIANIAAISEGNRNLGIETRYPIIYADPPWRYENPPIGASNRSIENHYPTMTLEEICALPVAKLASDHALLYLWATAPKLSECMSVISSWGFEYRTNLVWDKEVIGMGYHARNQHELLLVCKRGEIPPPVAGTQPSSVYRERRGEHSAKPSYFYEMIEKAYPELSKIELFCRLPRDGWSVWGNQSEAA